MGYLDNTGLAYFWEKIKSNFFPGTKEIPANADLNDYVLPGAYNCLTNTISATVSNAPTTKAFSLIVYRTGMSNSCVQFLSVFSNGLSSQGAQDDANRIFTRTYYYDNGWSPWAEIATSLDRPVDYTSAGWTLDTYADHCWHKMATFRNTNSTTDRRAVFLVTDSLWYGTIAPNGRPDLKIGLLHVHIRKTVGACASTRRLSFNLNTGYDPNDFVLVYNPVDDSDELWTRIPIRYAFRTFNLIETGLNYGGNRYYQVTVNPIEMYRRVRDSEGYASYPTGEDYAAIKAENSDIMQPSKGIRALEFSYAGSINGVGRLTSANNLNVGGGVVKYFNATSSMTVANGKPVQIPNLSGIDSHILHLPWDGDNGYDSQIAVPNNDNVTDPEVVKTMQWRAAGDGADGRVETLEDGTKIQKSWSDWHQLLDDQFIFDGLRPNNRFITRYAICSTAAATAVKTVDIPGFELYTGAFVIVTFANTNSAAVANLKLNVSNTGDIPIKHRNGNFPAAGELIANRPFMFVYDGTNWQLAIDIDHNTNNYDRLRTYYAITAKTQITAKNIAVADNNGLYFQLQTGTSFSLKYAPLYVTSTVKVNKTTTNAYYFCWCEEDAITACAAETLINNKAVYIKGNVVDDTFVPFAAHCLVCTEPVTEDGYQYYKLGVVKESATRIQIEIDHPIFEYVDGAFRLYRTATATNAEIDALFD